MDIVIGKLQQTEENMQLIFDLARDSKFFLGINEYSYLCYVRIQPDKSQLWVSVNSVTQEIRNCGINQFGDHRKWSSVTGVSVDFNNLMVDYIFSLTKFQAFNAMRIYMTDYWQRSHDADMGLLLSDLMLSNDRDDWKENLRTWDPPAKDDWMDGVNKTLHDLNIQENSENLIFDTKIAFLSMKNYFQLFYDRCPFEGVGNILQIINQVEIESETKEWRYWLNCVQSAVKQEFDIIA